MLNKAFTLACITLASNAIKLETTTSGEVDMSASYGSTNGLAQSSGYNGNEQD